MRREMNQLIVIISALAFACFGFSEVGDLKPGVYMSARKMFNDVPEYDIQTKGDVALVEFWNWRPHGSKEQLLSLNYGGSYYGQSMLCAGLVNLKSLSDNAPAWMGVFKALPIELGIYAAYVFDDDRMGTEAWDYGFVTTIYSITF
jgi:hypothetical protein